MNKSKWVNCVKWGVRWFNIVHLGRVASVGRSGDSSGESTTRMRPEWFRDERQDHWSWWRGPKTINWGGRRRNRSQRTRGHGAGRQSLWQEFDWLWSAIAIDSGSIDRQPPIRMLFGLTWGHDVCRETRQDTQQVRYLWGRRRRGGHNVCGDGKREDKRERERQIASIYNSQLTVFKGQDMLKSIYQFSTTSSKEVGDLSQEGFFFWCVGQREAHNIRIQWSEISAVRCSKSSPISVASNLSFRLIVVY